MPFIPHTESDRDAMLAAIGADSIEALFDEIPKTLPRAVLDNMPVGLLEQEMARLMEARQPDIKPGSCFIGGGAYEHYIPSAVWQIASRGEFYTAYTPYQAEASQGSLQLIYEYQTMMAELMALDVSNASLYEGATALSEAILMAVRIKRGKAKRVLIPDSLNPRYRQVLSTILVQQEIELVAIPFSDNSGEIDKASLEAVDTSNAAALVISQPNFFGTLEDVDTLTRWAHEHKMLVIGVVNPTSTALLKAPGQWGENGADIACGEGQPLGVPLASGGPYFGFMCCKKEFVRQLPGRLVGRTVDKEGREGFTLTLQAREQHIRRGKATSNICTNQGLVVVAATIYMSLLGANGLRDVALASHQNAKKLCDFLTELPGVERVLENSFFHEFVIRLPKPAKEVIAALAAQGLQAGIDLGELYPDFADCLLVCATETKTKADLRHYKTALNNVLK